MFRPKNFGCNVLWMFWQFSAGLQFYFLYLMSLPNNRNPLYFVMVGNQNGAIGSLLIIWNSTPFLIYCIQKGARWLSYCCCHDCVSHCNLWQCIPFGSYVLVHTANQNKISYSDTVQVQYCSLLFGMLCLVMRFMRVVREIMSTWTKIFSQNFSKMTVNAQNFRSARYCVYSCAFAQSFCIWALHN